MDYTLLYGWHAVEAALKNPHRKKRTLYYASSLKDLEVPAGVALKKLAKAEFDVLVGEGVVHQHIALEVLPLQELSVEEFAAKPKVRKVVILDQITDPHNIGAVLRSCAAFDVDALVITERQMPKVMGLIGKIASGALEIVPIITVSNLRNAIKILQAQQFWVYGLDERGQTVQNAVDGSERIALVLGAEGKGLRDLTKKSCDGLIRILTSQRFSTLNVSNAAAIMLHQTFIGE